jgi:hypothetical protein
MGIVRQEDCSPAARVAAAKAILDRGWGQPMAHPDSQPAAQITQIIREIVDVHKTAEEIAAETSEPLLIEWSGVKDNGGNSEAH